ncbi:MAG: aspartate aminotransferase family protein [Phycisphaeraceae bacterium]|nr:aspartate aminotransferase family protein [Phycisphaeraceae bacterium]
MSSQTQTCNPTIAKHDQFMTINFGRYPIVMERGQGVRLWDDTGKQYLDMFSGFGAGILGHCHPDLVQAVTEQANKLWHVGNLLHTKPQTDLAEAISKHGFDGRSFFCHTGADANEAALKLARLYGQANPSASGKGRYKVISATKSFHGRSFGTMPATGQEKVRQGFGPMLPGYTNVPFNDLAAIEAAIDEETVAVIVEPIQGEGGVNMPADDYLPNLRALCDKHDMLLICDEVWTGCGRTGKYFAHQHWGITPDMMTLAKGVGGGLAVGVMCAHERVAKHFDYRTLGTVVHATTLGGNCLAMAVAAKVFEVIERDNLTDHANAMNKHIVDRLSKLKNAGITDIRGKGLFIGVELDIASSDTWYSNVSEVVNKCLDRGVLLNGTQNNVLRIAPPLCITEAELDEGLDVLQDVLLNQ